MWRCDQLLGTPIVRENHREHGVEQMTVYGELIDQTVLTKQQAKVLELLYIEELEPEEAAQQLGVDVEYINGWKESALTSLREASHTVEVAEEYGLFEEI